MKCNKKLPIFERMKGNGKGIRNKERKKKTKRTIKGKNQ